MRGRSSAGLVAVALVSAPVLAGTLYSLAAAFGAAGAGAGEWGTSRITRVIASSETWWSVLWTLYTAGVATIVAAVAAIILSVVLQRSRIGRALAVLPLAVPYVAAGLAALLLLGQSGFLSRLAFAAGAISEPSQFPALVYDRPGVALILAFAWKEFPFLALTAFAVLDTRGVELADTARTLGAGAVATFQRVTLPLLWRGIAPATIAGFAYLVGQYELAVLLAPSAPQPLSVLTYERAQDPDLARRGEAHVLGLVAMTLCGALVVVHGRSLRGVQGDVSSEASDAAPGNVRQERTHAA